MQSVSLPICSSARAAAEKPPSPTQNAAKVRTPGVHVAAGTVQVPVTSVNAIGAPEALVPLMARTIENGFELTGPIARGDWSTVEAHRAALRDRRPELVPLYDALAEATAT